MTSTDVPIMLQNYFSRLLAQTSLRNILGTKNLHEILSDRDSIAGAMQVLECCWITEVTLAKLFSAQRVVASCN